MHEQVKEKLKELWLSGVASAAIGDKLGGFSGAHVRSIAIQLGLPPRVITDRRSPMCKELGVTAVTDIPEYYSWVELRRRVQRSRAKDKDSYARRKLGIDDRWQKFENFYRDMGPKPSDKHTVDRINNEKGYGPTNCRWATPVEQANNRHNTRFVEFEGETVPLSVLLRRMNSPIDKGTAWARINKMGWDVHRALTELPSLNYVHPRLKEGTDE